MAQTKIQGVGFLKIHATWNVLCREAELMKLKMPTKKVNSPFLLWGEDVMDNVHMCPLIIFFFSKKLFGCFRFDGGRVLCQMQPTDKFTHCLL